MHIQYQTGAYRMHPAVNLLPRWLARRLPNVPVVTTFHDLREPYLFPKATTLRRWVTHQMTQHSAAVVATNVEDAAALRAIGANVTVVPIGPNILPIARGDPWDIRSRLTIPLGAHLIGFFGFLNPTKGVDTLLTAVARLLDRDVAVVLAILGESVGSSDPTNRRYHADLLKLAGTLKLEPHLRWTGPLAADRLSQTLSALDACILPYTDGASYRRGTLITVLAHGLPLITTEPSTEGDPPLVPEQHCLLVPPNDPDWLVASITRILTDRTLRDTLKRGALELATLFSWDSIADKHVDLYHSL